jgi:hypothetical protein
MNSWGDTAKANAESASHGIFQGNFAVNTSLHGQVGDGFHHRVGATTIYPVENQI